MSNINSVFYAESYHPIQAGSIDGTDILPHDNAVYRAHLCSKANLYDPFGDPKVIGDPYCTLFVGRLSEQTDEESLRKAMSKFGRVKNLRLVRHIVTGASRGYAFVEYETDREMRRAYEDAHHSIIDGSEVIVDYNRQQLMPGWIPRRLGGGLGGKKESGQLRFGGQERPFRAPLRPIPYDELKILGIPAPPEGRYMSRFKIPSPPRRRSSHTSRENLPSRHRTPDDDSSSSHTIRDDSTSMHRRSDDRRSTHTIKADSRSPSRHRKPERERNSYVGTEDSSSKHRRLGENEHRQRHRRTPSERDETYYEQERHHKEHSDRYYKERSSTKEYSPHHREHPDRYYKEMSSTREYKPDRKKHSDQHYKESSLSREYSQHHEEHSDRYYKERSSTREYSPHRHKRKRSESIDIRGRDQEV